MPLHSSTHRVAVLFLSLPAAHRRLLPRTLLVAFALVMAAACTSPSDAPADAAVPTPAEPVPEAETPAQPRMEEGVQVVDIEAGPMGYAPRTVALQAGVPARLVFTRTVDSECSSQVRVPDFGVPPTDLPMHEPVAITFTPDASGTFTFVCGMDMQRGTLVVSS